MTVLSNSTLFLLCFVFCWQVNFGNGNETKNSSSTPKNCDDPRKCVWPRKNQMTTPTLNQVILPKSFGETPKNSTKYITKVTIEQLMSSSSTVDELPNISTAEPSQLVTSFKKTVIKGTCFDEYIYCREAINLCSHPAFSDVMASHCSLTCARCDEIDRGVDAGRANCTDVTQQCASYADLCEEEKYANLMAQYCPKTCGKCVPMCRDRHKNCAQYSADGFCHDEMYTNDEIKYLCGETCQMC